MTAPHADQLIAGYLARLSEAAAGLPTGPRNELIDDMRSHIAEARTRDSGEETDATILNILDRLGEPAVVVADARERLGISAASPLRPGILEVAALILLLVFWPAGVVLLWMSPAWNPRDKIIGTLVPPGGYMGVGLYAISVVQLQMLGEPAWLVAAGTVVDILILLLPLITTAYLAMRLRRGHGVTPNFA